jgi:hypothetical protein
MKTKNKIFKTADKLSQNHQGNYEIRMSFDLYGEGNSGDILVADLEKKIRKAFEGWCYWLKQSPKNYKIENIRYNE